MVAMGIIICNNIVKTWLSVAVGQLRHFCTNCQLFINDGGKLKFFFFYASIGALGLLRDH